MALNHRYIALKICLKLEFDYWFPNNNKQPYQRTYVRDQNPFTTQRIIDYARNAQWNWWSRCHVTRNSEQQKADILFVNRGATFCVGSWQSSPLSLITQSIFLRIIGEKRISLQYFYRRAWASIEQNKCTNKSNLRKIFSQQIFRSEQK